MNDWQPLVIVINRVLICISVVLGLLRVWLVVNDELMTGHVLASYTALSHVYVGMLLGAWLIAFDSQRSELPWKCLWNAVILSGVELACFLVSLGLSQVR